MTKAYDAEGVEVPTVNCRDQVRIWISADGLPDQHRVRLTRLRAMNPDSHVVLFVSHEVLDPRAAARVHEFGQRIVVDVRDVSDLSARDDDEEVLLEHLHAEIAATFAGGPMGRGNLSVVSDYARLLTDVLDLGLCADMDVEFSEAFAPDTARVACARGIIARYKDNGCLSNDVTAGLPRSDTFVAARRQAAALGRAYRELAGRFLRERYGERVEPETASRHPAFFELRNRRHDADLSGSARFSLVGGPDNLAIAADRTGIFSGYEHGVVPGVEVGELVPGHVPHQLAIEDGGDLRYAPYDFGVGPPDQVRAEHRAALWPEQLPAVIAHWDHSWIEGHQWQRPLTFREGLLLRRLEGEAWAMNALAATLGGSRVPSCLVDPSGGGRAPDAGRTADLYRLTDRINDRPPQRMGVWAESVADAETTEATTLRRDGIAALAGLVDDEMLTDLQASFKAEIRAKGMATSLHQVSFNLAVDSCARDTRERVRDLAHLPALTEVIESYFEGPARFVSARGYRQGPLTPLRYRAWDYHQDMKTAGPQEELKLMLLLTDVALDGQAMRYVIGSQRMRWTFPTQRETKFSLDDALDIGGQGLFVAYGPAGTAVVFDTNGIHSGHRNLSATRDVFTLNFARESSTTFYMFTDPILVRPGASARAVREGARTDRAAKADLAWRFGPVDAGELARIRSAYDATPGLEVGTGDWSGDAEGLIHLMAADLNADLDLRISEVFESDRGRDIALVRIRDAGLDDDQYVDALDRLVGPAPVALCLWGTPDPLAATLSEVELVRELLRPLAARADGEDAANCETLLSDLADALVRADGVQRLRSTVAYLCLASGWAHKMATRSGATGCEETSRRLLDLYQHVVTESDLPEAEQRGGEQ